jgi:hypothetical protein
MHFCWRHPVDSSLGFSDAREDRDGFLLYPRGKFAARNQFFNLGESSLASVRMFMVVVMMLVIMLMKMNTTGTFMTVVFVPV